MINFLLSMFFGHKGLVSEDNPYRAFLLMVKLFSVVLPCFTART